MVKRKSKFVSLLRRSTSEVCTCLCELAPGYNKFGAVFDYVEKIKSQSKIGQSYWNLRTV